MTIRQTARRFVLFVANAIANRLADPPARENPGSPEDDENDPDEAECMRPLRQVLTPEAAAMLVRPSADNAPKTSQTEPLEGSLSSRGLR
jgi:hypothetical protein